MKRVAASLIVLLLFAPALLAGRREVIIDDKADFTRIKTFLMREGQATTTRPELSNRLFLANISDAIRRQLSAKGLTESPDRPDVMVRFTIGQDRPHGPSVVFDRGTLVIEMTARESGASIWHGVYTDETSAPAKVAEKMPGKVQSLLAEFPPKKTKRP
jgi:hypothetical protein